MRVEILYKNGKTESFKCDSVSIDLNKNLIVIKYSNLESHKNTSISLDFVGRIETY